MTAGADLLEKARGLRPLIESEAKATDSEWTMTQPVIEALTERGLFHLMVPKALGGAEADTDPIIDVIVDRRRYEEFAKGTLGLA